MAISMGHQGPTNRLLQIQGGWVIKMRHISFVNLAQAAKLLCLLSTVLLLSGCSMSSGEGQDLSGWLYNIANQVPALMRLVVVLSYISGFGFLMAAMSRFKRCARSITMMSPNEGIHGPLILLLAALLLLFFPAFINIGTASLFGTDSIIAYQDDAAGAYNDMFFGMLYPIIVIFRLIGYIAFIKGVYLLSRLSGTQTQPGTFTKSMVHMVGGILAVNIEATYFVLLNSLTGTG